MLGHLFETHATIHLEIFFANLWCFAASSKRESKRKRERERERENRRLVERLVADANSRVTYAGTPVTGVTDASTP